MKVTRISKTQTALKTLTAGALVLAALNHVYAQYTPPQPPAPFAGFINEALRKDDPYMAQWDFGGSVRGRYEIKDGYGIPGVAGSVDFRDFGANVDNDYFLERIRVRGGYTDQWWSAMVEGQFSLAQNDKRFAYANVPPVPGTVQRKDDGPEADVAELHQAYFTLGNHKKFPLSVKIGRQEMSYGDERLVGAVGWNNIGRTFDTAKMRWQNAWFGADIFTSRPVIPQDGVFDVSNDYEYFSGIYANVNNVPMHTLDVYFFARNASAQAIAAVPSPQFPQPSARDIYTIGTRLKSRPGELGSWDYTVEGAYQFGNFQDLRVGAPAGRLDQSAYMFVAQGGYTFVDTWGTPRIGLEYSYGSGDGNPTDGRHQTFDNLFPTNHKFYGYMDFVSLQNIQDLRACFTLKPTKSISLALEGHGFWLATTSDNFYNVAGAPRSGPTLAANVGTGTGYGVNPSYDAYVGAEIDIVAGWAFTRFSTVEVGYGHFFAGDYIESSLSALGSQDANFFYAQLNVNF